MKVSKEYKKTVKFFFELGIDIGEYDYKYPGPRTESIIRDNKEFIDTLFTLAIMAKNYKRKSQNGMYVTEDKLKARRLRTLCNMNKLAKTIGITIHIDAGNIVFDFHGYEIDPEEIL